MKKILLSLMVLLLVGASSMATPTRGPIVLKRPLPPISTRPGSFPLTSDMEIFSAFQDFDEIIVTSEHVSATVTVTIYNEAGMVMLTTTETIAIGEDITLDITSLPAGAYILSISFGDTTYVGQFEV